MSDPTENRNEIDNFEEWEKDTDFNTEFSINDAENELQIENGIESSDLDITSLDLPDFDESLDFNDSDFSDMFTDSPIDTNESSFDSIDSSEVTTEEATDTEIEDPFADSLDFSLDSIDSSMDNLDSSIEENQIADSNDTTLTSDELNNLTSGFDTVFEEVEPNADVDISSDIPADMSSFAEDSITDDFEETITTDTIESDMNDALDSIDLDSNDFDALSTDENDTITENADDTAQLSADSVSDDILSMDLPDFDATTLTDDNVNDSSSFDAVTEEVSVEEPVITDAVSEEPVVEAEDTEIDPSVASFMNDSSDTEEVSFDDFMSESEGEEEISLDDFMDGGFSDESVASGNNGFEPGKEPASSEEISLDDFFDDGEFTMDTPQPEETVVDEKPLDMDISFDPSADAVETENNISVQFDGDYYEDEEEDYSDDSEEVEDTSSTEDTFSSSDNIDAEEIDLSDFGIDENAEETPVTQDVESAKNKEQIVDYDLTVQNEIASSAPIVNEVKTSNEDVIDNPEMDNTLEVIDEEVNNVVAENVVQPAAATTSVDASLLQQIVADLSSLRAEINTLRTNLAEIKQEESVAASATSVVAMNIDETILDNNIDSVSENITDNSADEGGFFSGSDDDDTIALSTDELSNILNTANFTEEEVVTPTEDTIAIEDTPTSDDTTVVSDESLDTSDNFDIFDTSDENTSTEVPFVTEDEKSEMFDIFDDSSDSIIENSQPVIEETAVAEPELEDTIVTEEPVVEESEPIFDDAVVVEPIIVSEPAVENGFISEPVIEDTVVSEPVIEDTFVSEPIIEDTTEPVMDDTVISEPVIEESSEPVIEETFVSEPVIEETFVSEPSLEDSTADDAFDSVDDDFSFDSVDDLDDNSLDSSIDPVVSTSEPTEEFSFDSLEDSSSTTTFEFDSTTLESEDNSFASMEPTLESEIIASEITDSVNNDTIENEFESSIMEDSLSETSDFDSFDSINDDLPEEISIPKDDSDFTEVSDDDTTQVFEDVFDSPETVIGSEIVEEKEDSFDSILDSVEQSENLVPDTIIEETSDDTIASDSFADDFGEVVADTAAVAGAAAVGVIAADALMNDDTVTSADVIEEPDAFTEIETSVDVTEISNTISDDDFVSTEDNNELSDSNIDYLTTENTSTEIEADDSTLELKKDIKSVLRYMDQLLENLPQDKIIEFAKSEEFATYKKLFSELGLS